MLKDLVNGSSPKCPLARVRKEHGMERDFSPKSKNSAWGYYQQWRAKRSTLVSKSKCYYDEHVQWSNVVDSMLEGKGLGHPTGRVRITPGRKEISLFFCVGLTFGSTKVVGVFSPQTCGTYLHYHMLAVKYPRCNGFPHPTGWGFIGN